MKIALILTLSLIAGLTGCQTVQTASQPQTSLRPQTISGYECFETPYMMVIEIVDAGILAYMCPMKHQSIYDDAFDACIVNGDVVFMEVPKKDNDFVDNQKIVLANNQCFVGNGTYRYTSVDGQRRTIRNIVVVQEEAVSAENAFFTVERVVDGDTIIVRGIGQVRLIGVDTPETVHPRKPVEYFGKEASAFTAKLLNGKKVRLEYDFQKLDKYKRTLAYVYLEDGTFVNAEIIKQGYGHAYTVFPFKYLEDFRMYQREAREASRGLWSSESQSDSSNPSSDENRGLPNANGKKSGGEEKQTVVYFTATGGKYHRDSCRHLKSSKFESTLADAKSRGLSPCGVCKPTE